MAIVSQGDGGFIGQGLDTSHVDTIIVGRHFVFSESIFVPNGRVNVEIHIPERADGTHHIKHLHHRRFLNDRLT